MVRTYDGLSPSGWPCERRTAKPPVDLIFAAHAEPVRTSIVPHLVIDEAVRHGPNSVRVDGVYARKHLGLGNAAAVGQHLAANVLRNACQGTRCSGLQLCKQSGT